MVGLFFKNSHKCLQLWNATFYLIYSERNFSFCKISFFSKTRQEKYFLWTGLICTSNQLFRSLDLRMSLEDFLFTSKSLKPLKRSPSRVRGHYIHHVFKKCTSKLGLQKYSSKYIKINSNTSMWCDYKKKKSIYPASVALIK